MQHAKGRGKYVYESLSKVSGNHTRHTDEEIQMKNDGIFRRRLVVYHQQKNTSDVYDKPRKHGCLLDYQRGRPFISSSKLSKNPERSIDL